MIAGKSPRALAAELRKVIDVSKYDAERLMRTELARVQTEAQKVSFEENGFEEYTFIANGGDGKTCPICADMDGQHFKVKDMMPGENAPPIHTNCKMSLPFDTIVWRGASSKILIGFDKLPTPIRNWKRKHLKTNSIFSTSLIKTASYAVDDDKDVIMAILVPKGMKGAGYVDDISFNKKNGLKREYEVMLQRDSEYVILEAQKFRGKTIIVVEWKVGHRL